jgi:hypothetical protein
MILFSNISQEYFTGESQDWDNSREDSLQLLDLIVP